MEQTNSLYFEHKGTKYSATVKEDITTEPKILKSFSVSHFK